MDQPSFMPVGVDSLYENRLTLKNSEMTSRDAMAGIRPFEYLNNHAIMLKCQVCQNHKDGLKSADYKVSALGCLIQGNIASAVRVVNAGEAEVTLYLKSKNNESDVIGRTVGANGRY